MRGITPKIWEKFGIFLVFLDNRFGIFGTRLSKGWYFFENLDLVTLVQKGLVKIVKISDKKKILTLDSDFDLGAHGLRTHVVPGLASVPRVVIVGGRHEGVHIPRLPTGRRVRKVDALVVLVPGDLGQWVSPVRRANQVDRLTQSDRLALDVTLDLGRTGRN